MQLATHINQPLTIVPQYENDEILDYILANYDKLFSHKISKANTYKTYHRNGKIFVSYLKDNAFNPQVVENFAVHLHSRNDIQSATKAAYGTAAKIIIERVCHFRSDLIPFGICAKLLKYVDWPMENRKDLREGPGVGEIQTIKNYIDLIGDPHKKSKIKTQFALLYMTGLRANEVCSVEFEDFNYNRGTLLTLRKGQKLKVIQLLSEVKEILQYYIESQGIREGFLFKKKDGNQMTRDALSHSWKDIFKKIGLGGYSIHDLRHSLGTMVAKATGDPYEVARVLGHTGVGAGIYYVDKGNERLKNEKLSEVINY